MQHSSRTKEKRAREKQANDISNVLGDWSALQMERTAERDSTVLLQATEYDQMLH